MKKVFRIIKNTILGILLVVYFFFVIIMSSLLLSRNDYGVTQFKDKVLILVDDTIANEKYPSGSLVIVKNILFEKLSVDDEIFVYEKDEDDRVKIVVSEIEEINTENPKNRFVVLKNDGSSWGAKYIAGIADKVHPKIGGFLAIIQSKWVFFAALIVPCFFILIYEIYLIIITLKFGAEEEEEIRPRERVERSYEQPVYAKPASDATIQDLMAQINQLKQQIDNQNKTQESDRTKEE